MSLNHDPKTIDHGFGEKTAAQKIGTVKFPKIVTNLPLSSAGDLLTSEISSVFQASFEYTVDNTELTTNLVAGGGTITQADAMAIVRTSATTASNACLQSTRTTGHRGGMGGSLRFTALFDAPAAGTEQFVGLVDIEGGAATFENGVVIGYAGLTFGLHRFTNNVQTTIAIEDWDDPLDGTGASGGTFDPLNLNAWYLTYGDFENPTVFWKSPDGQMHKVHVEAIAGTLVTPASYNPNYRYMAWAANGATTEDLTVKAGAYGFFIEGKIALIDSHQPFQTSGQQSKAAVTTEVALFTIRNKSLYATKTNFIDLHLLLISIASEASSANNLSAVRMVGNATLGGTPVYADINTTDSVVEIDTAGTTVTGGKELAIFNMAGKNGTLFVDGSDIQMTLPPGSTLTLAGSSVASATMRASLLWKELF